METNWCRQTSDDCCFAILYSSSASSSYASMRYSSPVANKNCTMQYAIPFCMRPDFAEIWLTAGDRKCWKASVLL